MKSVNLALVLVVLVAGSVGCRSALPEGDVASPQGPMPSAEICRLPPVESEYADSTDAQQATSSPTPFWKKLQAHFEKKEQEAMSRYNRPADTDEHDLPYSS